MGFRANKNQNLDHISHHTLSIKYGSINITLYFKEGGKLVDPSAVKAGPGGSTSASGLYEAFTVTGTIVGDIHTLTALQKIYARGGLLAGSSAIHSSYSSAGNIIKTTSFGNMRLVKSPEPTGENHGDESYWSIEVSLNDVLKPATFEEVQHG